MNKDEYLNALKGELKNYNTNDISKIMSQAKETVGRLDEEKLEEILGSPKFYALELIETNNIKATEKESNKKVNFLLTKILPYIILIIIGFIMAEMFPGHLYMVFFNVAMLVLIIRMIILQRGVMEICMVITLAIVTLFIVPFEVTEDIIKFVSVIFLILFGTMKIIVNSVKYFEINKKALKSNYSEAEDTVEISASFGIEHYQIKECQKLNLDVKCMRIFLDISEIKNDLDIEVNSIFSEINLKIKEDTYVIDNSSIILGGNVFDLDNNKKYKEGYTVTINGQLVGGVINMEA